jgi:putative FmdB family regulatory protein
MPLYNYTCSACGEKDVRVGGVDDQTATCVSCGGLMHRTDKDVFKDLKDE